MVNLQTQRLTAIMRSRFDVFVQGLFMPCAKGMYDYGLLSGKGFVHFAQGTTAPISRGSPSLSD